MKRKTPDKTTENPAADCYDRHQKYAICGLKKNKLKLWPLKEGSFGTLDMMPEKDPIKINLEGKHYSKIKLNNIPKFKHDGLRFCGNFLGTEVDKETTIGDLRLRLNAIRARQVEIDRIVTSVARVLLPLSEEIFETDLFESDSVDIVMEIDGIDKLSIGMETDPKKTYLPEEIKWLAAIHAKLLLKFTTIWAIYQQSELTNFNISFQYSRGNMISTYQWIEIKASAAKEDDHYTWLGSSRLATIFTISKRIGKPLQWDFYRNDVLFCKSSATSLKGETTWLQGFPPLKPNFTAVPIEIDDKDWPEPTTDLEVWQRSVYNSKWDPTIIFRDLGAAGSSDSESDWADY